MQKKEISIGGLFFWLDNNILFLLSVFLLIFIPLYPKWPLFDILPGYIVRVRLEDLLVGFVIFVWLLQLARKKVKLLPNPLLIPIGLYLAVGFLSMLSAIFITKTVPLQVIHIGKVFLHYARRIEYFSLFFILYSAVKNLKQVKKIIVLVGITLILISIYGFGQKYLYWPVYSTMNKEFSKGWRLVLTEHARVPSTFAGHYDLAAYLAFFLAIFLSLGLFVKNKTLKTFFLFVFIISFFLLILTASRASFIAYMLSSTAAIFLLSLRQQKRIFWGVSRWIVVCSFSLLVMFSFGDLSERFANFFKISLIKNYVINTVIKEKIFGIKEENLRYIPLSEDLNLVYSKSDMPPTVVPEGGQKNNNLPPDVYQDIPLSVSSSSATATGSSKIATGSAQEATNAAMIKVPRTYSETAFVVGLSSAIRFDALWPMAIKGFLRNPLLGSGYSTLNKSQPSVFTEAESTDNDYLRSLGETGLLGFITFFGIIIFIWWKAYKNLKSIKNNFYYAFVVGTISGIIALLINATYIDVFEASKVAFTFWSMMAILLLILQFKNKPEASTNKG